MSDVAIETFALCKQYRLGGAAPGSQTFREMVSECFRGRGRGDARDLWALRGVNLQIRCGEVVGLIGPNGAGKSTLLKILSRITDPTRGKAVIRGRVGSLLEVGTGFHPELTGRENVYLNGAVLGMKRQEISRKFDQIVAFAGVERFLDTPVKRYSSGMHVRLAFAVAAHLEPEILIADEVLAVGDAAFQAKCLGRMGEVARSGRTVVFVSHNMPSIRQMCSRAVLLSQGRVDMDGPCGEVIDHYLQQRLASGGLADLPRLVAALPEDPAIVFHAVTVTQDGRPADRPVTGRPLVVGIDYSVKKTSYGLRPWIRLHDGGGLPIFHSFAHSERDVLPPAHPGRYRATATIPADLLAPIAYELQISASIYNVRRCFPDNLRVRLEVQDCGRLKNNSHGARRGADCLVAPYVPWTTEAISASTARAA
jgi:lipopolysaccharide transport system ATP-binding protein